MSGLARRAAHLNCSTSWTRGCSAQAAISRRLTRRPGTWHASRSRRSTASGPGHPDGRDSGGGEAGGGGAHRSSPRPRSLRQPKKRSIPGPNGLETETTAGVLGVSSQRFTCRGGGRVRL